jgi:hypothetical protein
MTMKPEVCAVVCELASLKGWTRKYPLETDPESMNWLDENGRTVSANWLTNIGPAAQLLLDHTTGYYETREMTRDHCIVIGAPDYFGNGQRFESTVVYLRDHGRDKARALGYAAVVAAIKDIKSKKVMK